MSEDNELLANAKKFDANKKAKSGNLNRPLYDPKWRRRDYVSELCDKSQSMDDLLDELSGSKEDDNYLYGTKL